MGCFLAKLTDETIEMLEKTTPCKFQQDLRFIKFQFHEARLSTGTSVFTPTVQEER